MSKFEKLFIRLSPEAQTTLLADLSATDKQAGSRKKAKAISSAIRRASKRSRRA